MTDVRSVSIKSGILNQLLYSEVFEHPLTPEELSRFSAEKLPEDSKEIDQALESLHADALVERSETFVSVFGANGKVEKRQEGAERAEALFNKAVKVARFIQKFPFVEGVGISGSLSKGILHSDGDFDFFIITRPNRVWIARTLLILYKKVFLLNSRKYFCVNYFIDSEHLEIEEKNRFTAVEVATLIPITGAVFDQFYRSNKWVTSYFPQGARTKYDTQTINKPPFSRILQGILSGGLGNWADKRAMRVTFRRWKRKFGDFAQDKFDLTMKTRRYVSKHHPNDFQNKVLQRYNELKAQFKETHSDALKKHGIEL